MPLDPDFTDTVSIILENQGGQWTVIHFGPLVPVTFFFENLGLPLDFACIERVDA